MLDIFRWKRENGLVYYPGILSSRIGLHIYHTGSGPTATSLHQAILELGKPFLPRTVYMFGVHDEALAVLTEQEKKFLTDNRVPNLAIGTNSGVHGSAIFGVVSTIPYIRTLK